MRTLARSIRSHRNALGLSQTDYATVAGVSLATVQKVETGRANPSLSTLRSLLAPLGLSIGVEPSGADWDLLSSHGLPLASTMPSSVRPEGAVLAREVRLAALELSRDADLPGRERKRDALQALLLAIRTHFPTFYRRCFRRSPVIAALESDDPPGRVVKLARIAVVMLAEYL